MGLDIRLPIGLMFSLVGVLLTVFGLFGDKTIYQRSLAININLWWGIIMFIFGLVMLLFGLQGARATTTDSEKPSLE